MELGDRIPEFSLKDQNGTTFGTKDILGAPTIVYFYPKDFTYGCTQQACAFRDDMDEFLEMGVRVVGVSQDSVQSHARFASKYELGFTLLADTQGELRKAFGVKSNLFGLLPGRETFVFNAEGVLQYSYRSIRATSHIEAVQSFLNKE